MSLTPADAQALRHALGTVVVVPVTPLSADGNPDWDTYAALTGRLIDGGITVITPNGNTGEFYALSPAEARQAIETAAKASRGPSRTAGRSRPRHRHRRGGGQARPGPRRPHDHDPPAGAPLRFPARMGRLPRRHRQCGPRPRRRPVPADRAHHRRAHRRARGPGAERRRRQVRRPRRHQVRRRGQGRRDRPVHLAGRRGRADRARVLGVRRARLHLGPGQRHPRPGPGHARRAAGERLRRRDEGLGVGAPVRGTAPGRLLGRQRERGQGGHGPARPVPRRCPPAEPPAAGEHQGRDPWHPGGNGTWREEAGRSAQLPLVRRRAHRRAAGVRSPVHGCASWAWSPRSTWASRSSPS